jgi:hypothetical protein
MGCCTFAQQSGCIDIADGQQLWEPAIARHEREFAHGADPHASTTAINRDSQLRRMPAL